MTFNVNPEVVVCRMRWNVYFVRDVVDSRSKMWWVAATFAFTCLQRNTKYECD